MDAVTLASLAGACKVARSESPGVAVIKRVVSAFGSHPVESLSGLALAIVGVMLTAAGTDGPALWLYAGGTATTLGGALLSWTAGKAVSRSEALDEVRSQLGLVSKTLGQSAGQINRVVDQCIEKSLAAETGFMMVGQQAMLVGAQVSAIQEILGESFDSNSLLSTLTEVENLAERLDRKDRRGSEAEVAKVRDRLQEMRAEITGSGTRVNRTIEVLDCPYCASQTQGLVGVYPGDTAAIDCHKCASRFNAHRRSDGSVFSRMVNLALESNSQPPGQRKMLAGECVGCGSTVRVPANREGGTQSAVCTDCGKSLIFHPNGAPMTTDGNFEKLLGVPVGRYGSGGSGARPITRCEVCSRELRAIIRKPEAHFALDSRCRRLFEIRNEDFLRWREANEPETLTDDLVDASMAREAL